MKLTKLHLIIILALALIICPVLGVCQNTREGMYSKMPSGNKKKIKESNDDQNEDEDSGNNQ